MPPNLTAVSQTLMRLREIELGTGCCFGTRVSEAERDMSENADNPVLAHLREIGTKLDTLDKRFDAQGKRWDEARGPSRRCNLRSGNSLRSLVRR